jgi:hypothetical protein
MKHSIICLSAIAFAIASAFSNAASGDKVPSPDTPLHTAAARAQSGFIIQPPPSIAGGPTDADVGDSDSFGRTLNWLGLADMAIIVTSDCTGTTAPFVCQVTAPAPGVTTFNFQDVSRISLPKNAANSLLCYWVSPWFTVTYNNPTATPAIARITVDPTLTIESSVLDDPSLIDPTTGTPFNGKLLTAMTSQQRIETPLAAGMTLSQRTRDSSVCIAGFLSRSTLVSTYGLTDALAKQVFKKPMVVHLNLSGTTQYVSDAEFYYGFRIIGD